MNLPRLFNIALLLLLFLIISKPVHAQEIDVNNLNTIYYNTSQEDEHNNFLLYSANEIATHFAKVNKTISISTSSEPENGIFLIVNPNHSDLQNKNRESFKLVTSNRGVEIIGKTPIAVRHGTYAFLKN